MQARCGVLIITARQRLCDASARAQRHTLAGTVTVSRQSQKRPSGTESPTVQLSAAYRQITDFNNNLSLSITVILPSLTSLNPY